MSVLGDDLRRELSELVEAAVRRVLDEKRSATVDGDALLAPDEVGERTGFTGAYWRAAFRRGDVPGIKSGRSIRLRWCDVEAFLAKGASADELLARRRGGR